MARWLLTALAVVSFAAAASAQSQADAPPHIERLARTAKLWGTVRYLHPYLAYKDIDWDAALVAAIPSIRAATTRDEFAAALSRMLSALGDSVTTVIADQRPSGPPPAARALFRTLDDGAVVIDLGPHLDSTAVPEVFRSIEALRPVLARAPAAIIDLRNGDAEPSFWSEHVLGRLVGLLVPAVIHAPAQRYVLHSGYRPQDGTTSGGYYSALATQFSDAFAPDAGRPGVPGRLVFLADARSRLPAFALSLQASGAARIVSQGELSEAGIVSTRTVDLGEGLRVRVRVSEIVPFAGWRGVRPDVVLGADATTAALDAALDQARRPWPQAAPAAAESRAPDAVPSFRADNLYEEMKEPSLEFRQLAVVRAWNVIRWFYPYLHLVDNWDAVLPEFLARMETVSSGDQYAMALVEMMTHLHDTHTSLWGHPALVDFIGQAGVSLQARWIEGALLVTRLSDGLRASGLDAGDVIVAVDGEPVPTRVERYRRYVGGSTPAGTLANIARVLLRGSPGSTAVLHVTKGDGSTREVRVARDPNATTPRAADEVIKVLPGNWGYVDLTRLTLAEVDTLFEKIKDTRGLIMDMRGYPQGTAWAIAPRINTRKATVGAQFRRSLVIGLSEEEGDSGFYFAQPLPRLVDGQSIYAGPTVMLIDERAISQAEHSGLFFEAAAGTTFIGTASAGANGDVTVFGLPGGIRVGFTGHDVRHADGRQLQRIGLEPHVKVAPTIAGIRAGKDEVLERAVRFLEETRR